MAPNIHACAVVLADRGIVITGKSGSGKTQLALDLIFRVSTSGRFARLVADDQLFLSVHHGRLICSAPQAIEGLVEVRGLGPAPIRHQGEAPVDLLVNLVGRGDADRMPEPEVKRLLGCAIPALTLADDDRSGAAMAVLARLSMPPFGPIC